MCDIGLTKRALSFLYPEKHFSLPESRKVSNLNSKRVYPALMFQNFKGSLVFVLFKIHQKRETTLQFFLYFKRICNSRKLAYYFLMKGYL